MENKKEIKKYDPVEAKRKILTAVSILDTKDALMKELSEAIIPKCLNDKGSERDEALKAFVKKSSKYLRIIESESHMNLMESFTENYQMLSKEMADSITKEYDCTTEAEKALVTIMVNAFVRSLDNSRRLNNLLEIGSITPNLNIFFANLSKQIDRANRQYISALLTLKQLKAPQVELNIKTNNAFISNNQQINVNKDENIKA